MSDRKCSDDMPNTLSTRDDVAVPDDASLSDSDPEESYQPLSRKVEELSSSSDEEIVQHENSLPQGSPTFKLTGGSMGFSYRSKNIFDQLNSAVKLTSGQLAEDNVIDGTFARPAPPSPPMALQEPVRTRKALTKAVPDYQLHPERWTRYDLDDVPETDNRTNSQVAHEFIQGLQNRRRSQEAAESSFSPAFNQDRSGAEHKVIFTKPSQCSKDESQNLQVVDRAKTKEVGLVHLDDELEEEEKEEERKIAAPYNLSAQKKKRKWMDRGNIDEEDKDKGTNVMFSSVRKVNRKNIRKAVEDED